jgi:aspartyl-tRNA(Asn)/glutamyl-tRNA(Gln) amidotransferase subunit B
MTEYEAIIGLETHIQLNTNTKIFCGCKAGSWDDAPNTNICPVCTGMPGVLPVLNKAVVEKAIILAQGMNAEPRRLSFFDRKNYFYPDLPKGYQITQYDQPIGVGGYLDVPVPANETTGEPAYVRRVEIEKLHMEEDAGKTKNEKGRRLIDFNRCGVPLVEMVTGPNLRSAAEAAQYLIRLRQLLRWLGVSEADMEKGQLRCDANVSIRPKGADYLNTKTEIKNVNSIDSVFRAIETEIERQIKEVEAGNKIEAWTLDWNDDKGVLKKMRSKETEADYRYFREPDLLPLVVGDEWFNQILSDFPELPLARRQRFMDEYQLPEYDADILTTERSLSEYFEAASRAYPQDAKRLSNWLMNDVMRILNDKGITAKELNLKPEYLAEIIELVDKKTVNTSTGKKLLTKVEETGKNPGQIVKEEGLAQVSDDSAIREVCQKIIDSNPKETETYRNGKEGLIGWFVGQVMRDMRGKADPNMARTILEELLKQ